MKQFVAIILAARDIDLAARRVDSKERSPCLIDIGPARVDHPIDDCRCWGERDPT